MCILHIYATYMLHRYSMTKFHITGTRRGLGKALEDRYGNVPLEDCDVFINNKHDGFTQVEMLYKAARLGKTVISLGSHASDFTFRNEYAVEKRALREANNLMYLNGHKTTCLNLGYIDTERSADKDVEKMSVDYVIEVIEWILLQPHTVKELTVSA